MSKILGIREASKAVRRGTIGDYVNLDLSGNAWPTVAHGIYRVATGGTIGGVTYATGDIVVSTPEGWYLAEDASDT